jgi:ABC-2 type transport system permease protein
MISQNAWRSHVFSMEIRKIIAYRSDFWVNIFGQSLISFALAYFLWLSIFTANGLNEIGGMSFHQLMLYYLIAPLNARIIQGENIGFISREIYEGTMNKYLVYPLSLFQYKLTTYLAHASFYILQFFAYLAVYEFFFHDPSEFKLEVINLLCFLSMVIFSTIVYFMMSSILEMVAFWAEYIWSLSVMLRMVLYFLGGSFIPLSLFPDWAQNLLMYTPFPYFISIPMKTLMNGTSAVDYLIHLLILTAWFLIFLALAQVMWRKGNLKYTGVGI